MSQRYMMPTALTGLLLVVAMGAAARAADEVAKIPDHPTKLQYGPLEFEVPDGNKYRHKLKNGIPVYIAEDHALPLIDVSITIRAGAFLDAADKPGVAAGTGTMVRRGGAGGMSAEEFDERVEFLAANMSSFGGDLGSGASFNCISSVLDDTMDLFFKMLQSPGFQQDRMEVERENLLEQMKQRNDRPQSISGREWGWLMRGRDFFVSHVMTKDQLYAISRDDLIAFHKKYWRPENMIIAVSGDVDTKEMLAKLNQRFAAWKPEGKAAPVPWPPKPPNHQPGPGVYYVNKDIPQGRVLIGHLGYERKDWSDPEPFALFVMNDVLGGGGFTSRLVKRIRSDEGLAYSAGSSFGIGQYWPGVFNAYYQSKSSTVAYAAKIAMDEIERIRTEPVTEEELTVAKNSFIDVFPRRFESAAQIAGTFADDEYNQRSHDYWKSYRENIRKVTATDVMNAAKKHLHPDRLVMLVVGKWPEIEPGDPDGKATMAQFYDGKATELPLRDPLTLAPME